MSMEVEFGEDTARAVVTPEFGRRAVFVVERRKVDVARRNSWRKNMKYRWVVALEGSRDESGFTHLTSFDAACRSLLHRARRFDRAYSVPRGIGRAVAS
jgi:hypothetical protein